MMTTTIDPTTMTMDEYRAHLDHEDGRGTLHHYGRYLGLNVPIVDVLDYTVNEDGERYACVIVTRPHSGELHSSVVEVPLTAMFATKKRRPLGFKPVPWN